MASLYAQSNIIFKILKPIILVYSDCAAGIAGDACLIMHFILRLLTVQSLLEFFVRWL